MMTEIPWWPVKSTFPPTYVENLRRNLYGLTEFTGLTKFFVLNLNGRISPWSSPVKRRHFGRTLETRGVLVDLLGHSHKPGTKLELEYKTTTVVGGNLWVFPNIEVPQNGWFIMETPIKMDDLGVPPFKETLISPWCIFQKNRKRGVFFWKCVDFCLVGFQFLFRDGSYSSNYAHKLTWQPRDNHEWRCISRWIFHPFPSLV